MPLKLAPASAEMELRRLGFVDVTGLTTHNVTDEAGQLAQKLVQPGPYQGCWGYDNQGLTVAILENGRVFLCDGEADDRILRILRRACPKGEHAMVPCVDGYNPDWRQLLARVRNPRAQF